MEQRPRGRNESSRDRGDRERSERPEWQQRVEQPRDPNRKKSPMIPDEITADELELGVRVQLKTLTEENAEKVARHLAMVGLLIDQDPELAHEHALAAATRAGRIGMVREFVAATAYATGDYALALREYLTHRRITGINDNIALIVDCERGMGRPDRALEEGRAVDRAKLPSAVRVNLAIAMSGARLDRGEDELALAELEIPELNPEKVFDYSVPLFYAYAECLRGVNREAEAKRWDNLAQRAEEAYFAAPSGEEEAFSVLEEIQIPEPRQRREDGEENNETNDSSRPPLPKGRPSLDEIRGKKGFPGKDTKPGKQNLNSQGNRGSGRGKFGGARGR